MNIETKNSESQSLSPLKTLTCIYCKEKINDGSSKCQHCGNYQNKLKNWLSDIAFITSFVMILIAVAQTIINYRQMKESEKERVSENRGTQY